MRIRPRIIPVLGINDDDLVKTTRYKNPRYLGDPINAVKIFNGKYVDELLIVDIRASLEFKPINFQLLENIASQAFMPLGYGGGINTIEDAKKLFKIGYEKIVFSTNLHENPKLIKKCVEFAGSQSIVGSIDIKKNMMGKYGVYTKSGTVKVSSDIKKYFLEIISYGIGECIINFIDRDGMMNGFDLDLINELSKISDIPLIPNCGVGRLLDIKEAFDNGAHGVAASSIFVYYGKQKAVLITMPSDADLIDVGVYKDA